MTQPALKPLAACLAAGDHELHRPRRGDHAHQSRREPRCLGIARHAALQAARLADIEHVALGIEHAIDARLARQGADEVSDGGEPPRQGPGVGPLPFLVIGLGNLDRFSGRGQWPGLGQRRGRGAVVRGSSFRARFAGRYRWDSRRLRARGIPAVSGDASDPNVLIQAHIHRARVLVIATPDTLDVRRMIEIARTVNPRIETVVRTHSEEEAVLLEKEQAGKVFLGENELAQSMIEHVLGRYAAGTDKQH